MCDTVVSNGKKRELYFTIMLFIVIKMEGYIWHKRVKN